MRHHRDIGRYADAVELIRHELSTPVATALLYIGIAENHASRSPGCAMMPALRIVRLEVQRLKDLIDTVTELQRSGRAVLNPRLTDIASTVRSAVKRLLTTFPGTEGVAIVAPPRSLRGWWDRTAVEQIVNNLVSNALKFGQGRSIRLIVKASAAGASITVRDQGAGISPSDRLRIFERNIHAPTAQGGGHGIGLWLVRELAVAHGGRVTVHSRRGRGTTFTVFLRALPPMVGSVGPVSVTRMPPQRSPGRSAPEARFATHQNDSCKPALRAGAASPVRTVTYAAGSRREAAADYWHDKVARSQTKTPVLPRREADVAPISTSRPANRNRSFASQTLRGGGP